MNLTLGARVLVAIGIVAQLSSVVATGQSGASVTGRVVDSTRAPLRNALVTLRTGTTDVATASTTREGTFVFDAVPVGRYFLVASKPGYLPMTYGARRFGGLGVSLAVTEGSRLDLELSLPQAAVIAGRVNVGPDDPASGISVAAIRLRDGEPAETAGITKTDSHGRFRILGLAPGDYAIRSNEPLLSSEGKITKLDEADVDRLLAALSKGELPSLPATTIARVSYAPTYYPSVVSIEDALRVSVAPGEVREGIDIRFVPVHLSRLEGTVFSPLSDASGVQVVLQATQGDAVSPRRATQSSSAGAFVFDDVLPGHYVVMARARARQPNETRTDDSRVPIVRQATADAMATASTEFLYGSAAVDIYPGAAARVPVSIALTHGAMIAGRIVVDGAQPLSAEVLRTLRVTLTPNQPVGRPLLIGTADFTVAREAAVTDAGIFRIAGVAPGKYDLRVSPEPRSGDSPMWLRSIVSGQRDLLDEPLSIDSSRPLPEITVTFSARHTSVGGRLVTATGDAAQDCVIVIFSADSSQWRASSRTRIARSATDGRFSELDLPPGEYVLATLLDLDPATLGKGVPFADLVAAGVRFALHEGEQLAMGDLRVGG